MLQALTAYVGLLILSAATASCAEMPRAPVSYEWHLPHGFPVPADNPMSAAKVELGRRLFADPALSRNGQLACSSCHRAVLAFTDGRPKALGGDGEPTRHSAMTLTNVAYNAAFGWADARVTTLEVQMRRPLFGEHPVEMGLTGHEQQVLQRLVANPDYARMFGSVFVGEHDPVTIDNVIKAIAAFERTLISGRSAFDRYVFEDERDALSPAAKHGMALFFSPRLGCAQCHSGINFSGPIRSERQQRVTAAFANTGLYSLDGHGAYPADDPGLIEVTHRHSDSGKMRVPTLRNVALTAPYMHDGSIATLWEVIEHYAQGGRQWPRGPEALGRSTEHSLIDRRIRRFRLSADEKSDLLAFLESLTDPQFAADRRANDAQE